MKKLFTSFVAFAMMILLVACNSGGNSDLKVSKASQSNDKAKVVMEFHSNGDKVEKIIQTAEYDYKNFTEDEIKTLEANVENVKAAYSKIEGVEYTFEKGTDKSSEKIVMNVGNEATLKALIDGGMLPVNDKDSKFISLEQTLKGLEAAGFTIEK